jgi:transcriptional regulator with XRE-family HTH domain
MDRVALKSWRQRQGMTQKQLAGNLGVHQMAVFFWETGRRRIPALLPLALEALEHRLKEGKNGVHQ